MKAERDVFRFHVDADAFWLLSQTVQKVGRYPEPEARMQDARGGGTRGQEAGFS